MSSSSGCWTFFIPLSLLHCSGQWCVLAGLRNRWLLHTTGIEPCSRKFNAFQQVNLWLEAQFATGFLDAVAVVTAKHQCAKFGHYRLCVGNAGNDPFSNN